MECLLGGRKSNSPQGKGKAYNQNYGPMKGKGSTQRTEAKEEKEQKELKAKEAKVQPQAAGTAEAVTTEALQSVLQHTRREALETSREIKSLCTLTHRDEKATSIRASNTSGVNPTGNRKVKQGWRKNMFKAIETESDAEDEPAVDKAQDPGKNEK